MKRLIARTREDLRAPELTWYISEQSSKAPWRNMETVNKALQELSQTDMRLKVINTSELPHAQRHFGTQGTLLLGDLMAESYLKSRP